MRELDAIPKDDDEVKMYKGVGKMYVHHRPLHLHRMSRGGSGCTEGKDLDDGAELKI